MNDWHIPWWRSQFGNWVIDRRPVTDYPAKNDVVPCNPEELRKSAEKAMHLMKAWPENQPLPMPVYAAARVLASESDERSTAEEMVVMAEVMSNEGWRTRTNPASLLLTNGTFGRGANRFAATDKDPTVGHVMIAAAVLAGHTKQFSRGATAFIRPHRVGDKAKTLSFLNEQFNKGWGWAGHYPNIDIRRLIGLRPSTDSVDQIALNQEGLAALLSGQNPPPPTTPGPAPGEKQPIDWKKIGTVVAIAGIGSLIAVGTSYAVVETNTRRWKEWEPKESGPGAPSVPPLLEPPETPPPA